MAAWLKTRLPLAILMNHNVCFVMDLLNQAGIIWGTQESCVTFADGMRAAAQNAARHGSCVLPEREREEWIQAHEGKTQSGIFSVPYL